MRLTTKIRYTAQLWLGKSLDVASSYALMPSWGYAFGSWGFHNIVAQGYQRNAAYLSCIAALAFSFPEPPLLCWDGEDASASQLPTHPLRKLLARPNADMGEAEFKAAIVTWMAIGGNAYIYKLRNTRGQVIALRPYHDGVICPVASRDPNAPSLIDYYEFTTNEGRKVDVPRKDIIHIKWPLADVYRTYMAQPPILAAAREVDSDNEATRYVAALLQNDAVPRTIISPSSDIGMSPDEKQRARDIFTARHGGDRRGGVEVLDFGAKIERLSLNMEELNFAALHDIPEQRICAVMRVPSNVAGLGDDPTYANSEEATNRFTRNTLVPLWRAVESEIQADLAPEFGDVVVRHDLGRVAALQEAEDAKWTRVTRGYTAGLLGFRESRSLLGQPAEPDPDDLFVTTNAAILERFSVIVSEEPEQPQITVIPTPAQLPAPDAAQDVELLPTEDTAKRRAVKANPLQIIRTLRRLRLSFAIRLQKALDGVFGRLATAIVGRITSTTPDLDTLITADDARELKNTLASFTVNVLDASWDSWNTALGVDAAFDAGDPAVVKALVQSAKHVTGIMETTREAIRTVLQQGAKEGWTVDQLVSGVDGKPGLRDIVEETYKDRARTIARTEMTMAQNIASHQRFADAGVTKVTISDGGGEDSDDVCTKLNGTVQTLEWFAKNPTQHPNCVRAAVPYVD